MGAIRTARRRLETLSERHSRLDALLHDRIYRAVVGATGGLAIDVVFAAWNLALGAAGLSIWFATMGCLYLALAVMRFLAMRREAARRRRGDIVSPAFAHAAGGLMIVLATVLGIVVFLTITKGKGAAGNEIVVISQATYTFYVLILAAINYARARRSNTSAERMLRSVSSSAALVSLLSLQTTMIDSFGGNADLRLVATAGTGSFACAVCVFMGVDLLRDNGTAARNPRQEAPVAGKQSRYFETAALIDEAFLCLLAEKDFEFITVKEICQKAGVGRSTFYLHYETMHDLLTESVEYVNARFLAQFGEQAGTALIERIPSAPLDELRLATPEYLLPYLVFIRDNQRLFGTLAKNYETLRFDRSLERMMRHIFVPILRRFGVAESDHAYLMAFYLNGLMAIINEWLRKKCADDTEHVARLMQRCCEGRAAGEAGV